MMPILSKADLRSFFLNKRLGFSGDNRSEANQNIIRNFFANVSLKPNVMVAGYYPFKGEADILPIMSALNTMGHKCLLPIVVSDNKPLEFVEWYDEMPMKKGILKTMEPEVIGTSFIPDVILVPFVAFSENKYRIGYGKGMYDRTISDVKTKKKVTVIGIGYELQKADAIPSDVHDIAMDMVITDLGVYT